MGTVPTVDAGRGGGLHTMPVSGMRIQLLAAGGSRVVSGTGTTHHNSNWRNKQHLESDAYNLDS